MNILSRCFKNYDVKHLRHGGCVPATQMAVEEQMVLLFTAMLTAFRFS
jgi:hypothetical protein